MANTKLKVGDKVKVINVSDGNCNWVKVGMVGEVTKTDESGVPYKVFFKEIGDDNWFSAQNVELYTEWQEGDILVDDNDAKVQVLGVVGKLFFISQTDNYTRSASFFTKEELDARGYKKEGDTVEEVVEELTMEEVCAQLGKTIKIKK